ncbi:LssY C-terminal domain-containing protein [Ruania suaedae]|uniref:LssY C-terminal domain-containing protein n=1 Tax=Ruania suaedae TaxID=2897774 RepID=UPI001E2AF014|nr:LssY C-terminal domain-containing protein [Ruania suaedae]UFU02921.1 LssY C-terminal domain-containing protein [Ruania suaedae]
MPRTLSERAHAAVEVVHENPVRFADHVFFVVGTVASGWLAFLLVHQLLTAGWRHLWAFVPFWVIVTYLLLPRLHRLLTLVYVPNYFIGRSRTREGLLGDPVNLGLRGTEEQIHTAMLRAGWHRADEVNLESSRRMIVSTLLRRSYPDAPVSPLFLFGRRQNFTYQQEVEGNPAKRHHVRFWPCPAGWRLPGGKKVDWLAAGTYDTAVGLSHFTLQVTHRIDADIDAERDHILGTLTAPGAGNQGIAVKHLLNFSTGYHHRNGGGDEIRTDGDLPIVDLRATPPPSPDIVEEVEADDADNHQRRAIPLTVAFGMLMMLLRVVTGIVGLAWLAQLTPAQLIDLPVVTPLTQIGVTIDSVVVAVRVCLMAYLLAYLVLAFFVYRRANWARTATLLLGAFGVLTYAVLWIIGAPEAALTSQLLGTSVEILVLLALSSETARVFTRGQAREGEADLKERRALSRG